METRPDGLVHLRLSHSGHDSGPRRAGQTAGWTVRWWTHERLRRLERSVSSYGCEAPLRLHPVGALRSSPAKRKRLPTAADAPWPAGAVTGKRTTGACVGVGAALTEDGKRALGLPASRARVQLVVGIKKV
eukprot:226274-Prymnesium_polylepis.1